MGRRAKALGLVAGLALLLTAAALAAKPKSTPAPIVSRLYVQNVNLSPKPHGEPGASGTVTICLNPATGAVAYNFTALTLADTPKKGQIRRGAAGSPLVTFGAPGMIDPNVGEVEWNDSVPATAAVVAQLSKTPSGFYVVVTTRAHSSGALTGRLAGWKKVSSDSDAASECAFS
jgi:hypothetical protein